jgi:hypothetical protein
MDKPDIFSVPRRFDMATILVAMTGAVVLFTALLLLNPALKLSPAAMGAIGGMFVVVALGQAIAIRWKNPRLASVIAGGIYWLVVVSIFVMPAARSHRAPEFLGALCSVIIVGPVSGY